MSVTDDILKEMGEMNKDGLGSGKKGHKEKLVPVQHEWTDVSSSNDPANVTGAKRTTDGKIYHFPGRKK